MILEQMKPNFNKASEVERREIFENYINKRIKDMTVVIAQPKSKGRRKAKGKQVKLSTEQYELLQKLGLV